MSNAEKIAEEAKIRCDDNWFNEDYEKELAKKIETHTNATLQELKERVEKRIKIVINGNYTAREQDAKVHELKRLIETIEDMTNE